MAAWCGQGGYRITNKQAMAATAHDKEAAVQVFKSNATDISKTCKALGITRKTFYTWYNNDRTFRDAIDEAKEEIKDFGESQLLLLMKGIPKKDSTGKHVGWVTKPDTAAVIFFNKTKNKDRGYVERVETQALPEPEIDLTKLTKEERKQWYALYNKAAVQPTDEEEQGTQLKVV